MGLQQQTKQSAFRHRVYILGWERRQKANKNLVGEEMVNAVKKIKYRKGIGSLLTKEIRKTSEIS